MKKVMTVRAVMTTLVKYVSVSMANLDSLSSLFERQYLFKQYLSHFMARLASSDFGFE